MHSEKNKSFKLVSYLNLYIMNLISKLVKKMFLYHLTPHTSKLLKYHVSFRIVSYPSKYMRWRNIPQLFELIEQCSLGTNIKWWRHIAHRLNRLYFWAQFIYISFLRKLLPITCFSWIGIWHLAFRHCR